MSDELKAITVYPGAPTPDETVNLKASGSTPDGSVGSVTPGPAVDVTPAGQPPAGPDTGTMPMGAMGAGAMGTGAAVAGATYPGAAVAGGVAAGAAAGPQSAPRTVGAPTPVGAGGGPSRDRTGRVRTTGGTVRPARKARLRIAKVDPWSVMKTALMFSIAAAIIIFVAVALLWSVIEASGALNKLQETLNALLGNPDGSGTVQVNAYIDRWRVLGFTAIVSGVNVILLTALATLWAFLYNLSSSVLGGFEVTLAEE